MLDRGNKRYGGNALSVPSVPWFHSLEDGCQRLSDLLPQFARATFEESEVDHQVDVEPVPAVPAVREGPIQVLDVEQESSGVMAPPVNQEPRRSSEQSVARLVYVSDLSVRLSDEVSLDGLTGEDCTAAIVRWNSGPYAPLCTVSPYRWTRAACSGQAQW